MTQTKHASKLISWLIDGSYSDTDNESIPSSRLSALSAINLFGLISLAQSTCIVKNNNDYVNAKLIASDAYKKIDIITKGQGVATLNLLETFLDYISDNKFKVKDNNIIGDELNISNKIKTLNKVINNNSNIN